MSTVPSGSKHASQQKERSVLTHGGLWSASAPASLPLPLRSDHGSRLLQQKRPAADSAPVQGLHLRSLHALSSEAAASRPAWREPKMDASSPSGTPRALCPFGGVHYKDSQCPLGRQESWLPSDPLPGRNVTVNRRRVRFSQGPLRLQIRGGLEHHGEWRRNHSSGTAGVGRMARTRLRM